MRKAIHIDLVFSDVFASKKHKYGDRNSQVKNKQLRRVPTAIFNTVVSQQDHTGVFISEYCEEEEEEIELNYTSAQTKN